MWTYGNDSPCRKCTAETGRHVGCHSTCIREKEYIESVTDKREKIRNSMIEEANIKSYHIESCLRHKNKRR